MYREHVLYYNRRDMRFLESIQGKFERDKQGTNVKSSTLCLYTSTLHLQADTPIHPARQRQRLSIHSLLSLEIDTPNCFRTVSCHWKSIFRTAFVTHNDLIDDFTRTKHFVSATHYNRVCVSIK